MSDLSRRDFLKTAVLAGVGAAAGCSSQNMDRIEYVDPPQGLVPGESSGFATTCRECPAGCGLLAKNRDSHVIKAEGNPRHPISRGTLCPRGQASLQGLYNPDRFRGPMKRGATGSLEPIGWDEAARVLLERVRSIGGKGKSVVLVTELLTGTLQKLADDWMGRQGFGDHILYEPYAYESLRAANRMVFGNDPRRSPSRLPKAFPFQARISWKQPWPQTSSAWFPRERKNCSTSAGALPLLRQPPHPG